MQLLGLVTRMDDNEGVTNINPSTDVRTTERRVAVADPQNILKSPTVVKISRMARNPLRFAYL